MPEFKKSPENAAELSFLISYYRSQPIYGEMSNLNVNQHIAMLHPDILLLLYHFGAYSTGGILEIGPYIGGSTIAISKGIQAGGGSMRLVSVEIGGSMDHPTHGSKDIVADLKHNLEQFGVADCSRLIIGDSGAPETVEKVKTEFSGDKLGLLFIDADGKIEKDFKAYGGLLRTGTYLVVDDYFSNDEIAAREKTPYTKSYLDELERQNKVECFGVYGWGTWIGRAR
jgi:predicted O-methyltransferase YrrM